VGSAVLIWFGYGFVEIVMLTAAARILVTAFALVHLRRAVPEYFRGVKVWDTSQLRELLSFGGWVTVSQVISPLFLYADRFLIGSLISLSAVALYALPQEALVRLIIIPMSLTTTLFPALSQESTKDDGGTGWAFLYSASLRHLFHVILPLAVILVAFAREILYVWVGPEYAEGSTIMFQIITCGFLFNAMAQIPMAGLQAIGRPDLPARFHVVEFLVSITLNVLLIPVFGVTVVAVIWSVRAAMDALLLGAAVHRLQKPANGMSTLFIEMVGASVIVAGLLSIEPPSVRLVVALGAVAVYLFAVWRYSFGERERNVLKSIAGFRHFKAL
jgi:O-antigen/teichoic acid export membrane protein